MRHKYANIFKMKYYAHFDEKKSWHKIKHIIEDPVMVAKHGFYPFIHYTKKIVKFNRKTGKKTTKWRDLFYSSHIDRYIYEFYAYKLNCLYNERAKKDGINRCAIAYRNNLHKSNIHFAKEVFDFIRKHNQAYIIIGDFTNFFDNLDHAYLKSKICDLLGVNTLPNDYYAVYKSITKYSYFDLNKLLDITGLKHKELNQKNRVLDINEFRHYKRECLKKNNTEFGIPQGSAISAVLSNIYMLDFDKNINNFITSKAGLYRRYSDDFIIAIPQCNMKELRKAWNYINKVINSVKRLELQPNKTRLFEYNHSQIKNCNNLLFEKIPNSKDIIDYLGFSFDGKVVTIRDKTISKYYYRMYRKVDTILKCNWFRAIASIVTHFIKTMDIEV